jgi:hypothetical protein
MSPLTNISFARDGRHYELALDFDDEAVVADRLVLQVKARVTDERDRSSAEESLTLEIDLGEGRGRVLQRGEEWYAFSLGEVPVTMNSQQEETIPGIENDVPPGGVADPVGEFVESGIAGQVEALIEALPVPDPFLGCALKAGISSALGQTLVCNERVGSGLPRGEKVRGVMGCLREHIGGIFSRALWRAARCMVRLGLF